MTAQASRYEDFSQTTFGAVTVPPEVARSEVGTKNHPSCITPARPVTTADGLCYDRAAIEEFFKREREHFEKTGVADEEPFHSAPWHYANAAHEKYLESTALVPDDAMLAAIDAYCSSIPEAPRGADDTDFAGLVLALDAWHFFPERTGKQPCFPERNARRPRRARP